MKKVTRRKFIKTSASLVAAYGVAGCSSDSERVVVKPKPKSEPDPMPTRPFGQTGFNVCLFSLGGQAALETAGQEDLAEEIINRALDLGVNYIDTSAYYGSGDGQPGLSEQNIGRATNTRRDKVFLATKTLERTASAALRDLERSLTNLQTDYVDLWQLHNIRTYNDIARVLMAGGAYEALQQAKTDGTARFIGVSGHFDPAILQALIRDRDFDTVLMAINAADVHFKSFIHGALPTAVDKNMGIIAMKIPARGQIFREGGITTMEQAMYYVLSQSVSTVIIGCSSVENVEENVQLARDFTPYSNDELRNLEALTATYYTDAAWFKISW